MSSITRAELTEIVPGLRAMAAVETLPEVRAAMLRLANLYAAESFMTTLPPAPPHAAVSA